MPKQQKITSQVETNGISSFFPLTKNNSQESECHENERRAESQINTLETRTAFKIEEASNGRLLETAHGENVFIPTLNFESVCSNTECSGDNFNKNNNRLAGNILINIQFIFDHMDFKCYKTDLRCAKSFYFRCNVRFLS